MTRPAVILGAAALLLPSLSVAQSDHASNGLRNSVSSKNTAAAPGKPNPHSPNPNASPNAAAIQAILQTFDSARDQIVSRRQTLLDQLGSAKNETERQSLLEQLRAEQQTIQDQQRATAKEIRAELQTLRRQRSGG